MTHHDPLDLLGPPLPRILLVEDDATSAQFLAAAASALPAHVEIVASLASARAAIAKDVFDLWLMDANLPDGSSTVLLAELRAQGLRMPALAHTAAHDRSAREALEAAGFDAVLVKPLPAAALREALRDALRAAPASQAGSSVQTQSSPSSRSSPSGQGEAPPIWDDAIALAALGGNATHVQALRGLCLGELPAAGRDVRAAADAGDIAAMQATLHRLRASCGFVGATRLDHAVRALQDAPDAPSALLHFEHVLQDTASWPSGPGTVDGDPSGASAAAMSDGAAA